MRSAHSLQQLPPMFSKHTGIHNRAGSIRQAREVAFGIPADGVGARRAKTSRYPALGRQSSLANDESNNRWRPRVCPVSQDFHCNLHPLQADDLQSRRSHMTSNLAKCRCGSCCAALAEVEVRAWNFS